MKKKHALIAGLIVLISVTSLVSFTSKTQETEFLQITTIESVVPMGLGRSRMISINNSGEMQEEKMENFFSAFGINFGNVRANDRMITDKITLLANEGWQLIQITPGVYGSTDGKQGIFITRYLFKK